MLTATDVRTNSSTVNDARSSTPNLRSERGAMATRRLTVSLIAGSMSLRTEERDREVLIGCGLQRTDAERELLEVVGNEDLI